MKYLKVVTLLATTLAVMSCSNSYHHKDADFYHVKPTPPLHLLEVGPLAENTENVANINNLNDDVHLYYEIDDRIVYKFTYLVEDTMRKRVDHGRKWEEGLSAMQVIFAAFASAFSASTGVHPDVVTTLAGLSALTPDVANIINAGGKAKAYSQGLDLIETANATYIRTRSEAVAGGSSTALIPAKSLTPEGATLFVSVMSTLKIMRDALLLTIPTEEDLAKAKGHYSLFALTANQITIEINNNTPANQVELTADAPIALSDIGRNYFTRVVSIVKGGTLSLCSSDSPNIAKVTECSGKSLSIEPLMEGEASITVVSDNGSKSLITVVIKDSRTETETETETDAL